jgi:tetratricopeptide (TPR) repeat protein
MMHAYDNNATVRFVSGYSAAKLGKIADAEQAKASLTAAREKATGATGLSYRGRVLALFEKQLEGAIAHAKGDADAALALLKEATRMEAQMDPPSGPPEIVKPSFEQYGELLLAQGRAKEAAAAFEQGLLRTPNRALAVRGLAKAKAMTAAAETQKRG